MISLCLTNSKLNVFNRKKILEIINLYYEYRFALLTGFYTGLLVPFINRNFTFIFTVIK